MTDGTKRSKQKNVFETILGLFAEVRAGEGAVALLMMLNVFLLLTSYYILKVVREPLILRGGLFGLSGEELKSYASAVQAFLLLGVVPAYGWLGSKVNRITLLNVSMAVFIGCLLLFNVLAGLDVPLGLIFFLWLGIFNVFVIAQFWSYANDIYTVKQGKRLFAIIAVGGSVGAMVGPMIAKSASDNLYVLMVIAASILVVCTVVYNIVNRLVDRSDGDEESGKAKQEPLSKEGGFRLVLSERYLLLIALMILVANLVNTTGEFILSKTANAYAMEQVPDTSFPEFAGEERVEKQEDARGVIKKDFFADFFWIVNICGFLIQAFLVSRIFKYVGVRVALFILPVIAFGGYAVIGAIGGLLLIRIAKTAENSTDYSLQNTVRQALFLPTTREIKYKAKAAIDTFFVRIGDAMSAGLVYLGIHHLHFEVRGFAFTNVVLILVWIAIVVGITRLHKQMVPDDREVKL